VIFHSIDYLLFLPVVAGLYFCVPPQWRWALLLAASNVFYASWRLEFLALLWFTTLVDYTIARIMPRYARPSAMRKTLLGISLLSNIGLLCFFKYTALLAGTTFWDIRVNGFGPEDIILPLGISFYTFQTLGYTIDVYRGRREPETHLGIFSVYVMYFPQLLAGPIERPYRLLPQLRTPQAFDLRRAAVGVSLIMLGYFKKLVIADRIALTVPDIMAAPELHTSLTVTFASFASIYRYYADLSGYADIAIGSSLIMGIALSPNFNRPFSAVSISEFWQRWHITVTNWFRDYLYIPVARTAKGWWQRPVATIVTITVLGLWHGAAWSWLAAGAIAGVVMVIEGALRRRRAFWGRVQDRLARIGISPRMARGIGNAANRAVLWAFLILLGTLVNTPGWDQAWIMWTKLATLPADMTALDAGFGAFQISRILIVAVLFLEAYQWFDARKPVFERLEAAGPWVAWPFWYGLTASILVFGVFVSSGFLYFNF